MEEIKLVQLGNDERVTVLKKLGFGLDCEGYVLDKKGKPIICRYSQKKVHINTAAILPGSVIVINANPITMAEYFLELASKNG